MIDYLIGVFTLNADTFEKIEHDESATSQAALVVLVVALLGAVGGLIGALLGGNNILMALIGPIITAFLNWILWSVVTYFVGTSLFAGQANMGEMLRVVGFANAPGILGIIPCFGWIVGLLWTLAAMVVAIRQGLDVDTTKALIIGVIGFVIVLILNLIIGSVFGIGMAVAGGILGS